MTKNNPLSRILTSPNPPGLLLMLTILSLLSGAVLSVHASDPPARDYTEADVETMILYLVAGAPRHPGNRQDYREKHAERIVMAANAHGIPADLVAAIAFRESSFRGEVVGPGGELGTMQVHPATGRRFGCDLTTVTGQYDCGCEVLAWHRDRCGGGLRQALAAYGSRRAECHPRKGSSLAKMVSDRFHLAGKLRETRDEKNRRNRRRETIER